MNVEIQYKIRSRRVSIRVLSESDVRITVPYGMNSLEIDRLLQLKKQWIIQKQQIFKKNSHQQQIVFQSGQFVPFCGQQIQIKLIEGLRPPILSENILYLSAPVTKINNEKYIRKILIQWYQQQALSQIKEKVVFYAQQIQMIPRAVILKNYKSRWGTCTSKGYLMFNWQIILFEPELFNYVVAHEVCHLKEMNHSPRFYHMLYSLGFDKNKIHAKMRTLRNIF